jgi:thiamine-phosphate pyrophosphorylase
MAKESSQSPSANAPVDPSSRCRLVLVVTGQNAQALSDSPEEMFAAGDIASIIFDSAGLDEVEFQSLISPIVAAAQKSNIAVIVANETRVAGRVGADGLQLGQDPDAVRDAIEKYTPQMMVGVGNVKSRHNALTIGELQPDYVMFGKPGGDIRAEPHPKNVDLAKWWSAMVEIPCILLGGNALESVIEVAQCGADFVALENAIFLSQEGYATKSEIVQRIRDANRLLDEHAPLFEIFED